jgi:hypothetical protein
MARLAGVDLPRAVLDGWLSRSELASIVSQCQEGGCKDACLGWLGWLGKEAGPAQPPAFCAIRAEIAALAPEGSAQ